MARQDDLDRPPCRPTRVSSKTTINPSNDDSNRTQRLSVTGDVPSPGSMDPIQALTECCNILVLEMTYHTPSGKLFWLDRAHPKPKEIQDRDPLTRQLSCSSVGAVEDSDYADIASESGQARGLPGGGGRQGQAAKRKRRSRSSSILASRKKRKATKSRQATPKSGNSSKDKDEEADAKDELAGAETDLQQIRIDEAASYYDKALRSMKQLCCRDIAKAWIRCCHLKKQTTHPYNGGKRNPNTARSMAEYGYEGHFTKPDYWPSDEGWGLHTGVGVRHKEPDHLDRTERLELILHILEGLDKGYKDGKFTLEKLKKATKNIHLNRENGKNWTPASLERLEEIYRVRAKEMEFERGQIDGDTLVTIQMFKPRRKIRGARKSTVKAAKPSSKHDKKGPEQKSPTVCNTPAASMCLDLEMEDESIDLSEVSEPSIHMDTPSSTEEVVPDEPTLYRARRIQHGRRNSVQENWTMQSADLRQTSNISAHPTPDGYVVTRGEPQRSLPLGDQHRFGSSSVQTFPSQVAGHHNDYMSTASQRVASQNRIFTHSPPARPVAPKVENVRYLGFAASSSGTVGAFPENDDYTSWQIQDRWTPQAASSAYTAAAGSSASPFPSTNTSFSTTYGDARLPTGPQLDTWNNGNQVPFQPYYQSFDADPQQHFGMQTGGIPPYDYQELLDMHTPSGDIPDLANQSVYSTDFHTRNHSFGPEQSFGPFSQDHRQL